MGPCADKESLEAEDEDYHSYWYFIDNCTYFSTCDCQDPEFSKRLNNAIMDLSNFEMGTPLRHASRHGCLKAVRMIIEAGGDVNTKDKIKWTPLHEVARVGGIAACKYLLQQGADATAEDDHRLLPLHVACKEGHLGVIRVLENFMKKKQNSVNPFNIVSSGQTPLIYAITSKRLEVVKYLIDNGADVNIPSDTDLLPLHFAASSYSGEIYDLIRSKTERDIILKYCTFPEAIETTDLMENDWFSESFWSRSILCRAIYCCDKELIETVLKSKLPNEVLNGPHVFYISPEDSKKYIYFTPLCFFFCVFSFYEDTALDVLKLLIDYKIGGGDTFKSFDTYVSGPIETILCSHGLWTIKFKIIKYLLQNGANADEGYLNPSLQILRSKRIDQMREYEADTDDSCTNPPTELLKICIKLRTNEHITMLLLKASNIVEPEDLLRWVVANRDKKIIQYYVEQDLAYFLLTMSPYYTMTPSVYDFFMTLSCECDCVPERITQIYEQPVRSLADYCRSVVRRQLHNETRNNRKQFAEKLNSLPVPEAILSFLKFSEIQFLFTECSLPEFNISII